MSIVVTGESALQFLERYGISFQCYEHPAISSGHDAERLGLSFGGQDTKNLFLAEEKGTRLFLVTVPLFIKTSLQSLAKTLGLKRLTFGSADLMLQHLGITPGSVTPLALCNDKYNLVTAVVDEVVWNASSVEIHPMRNTATVVIPQPDFRRMYTVASHQVIVMQVPRA